MPTTEQVDRLGTVAAELRDACLAALGAIGEYPDGYLYPGLPPVEVGEAPCDGMLAVYIQPVARTPWTMGRAAGDQWGDQNIVRLPAVTMTIVYARCANLFGDARGNPPAIDDLNQEAMAHARAGWALMNGVYHAILAGELSKLRTCRTWDVGAMNPLPAQGQSTGWSLPVTVQMDGYDPFE